MELLKVFLILEFAFFLMLSMRVYLLDTKSLLYRISALTLVVLGGLAFWEYEMLQITRLEDLLKIVKAQTLLTLTINVLAIWTAQIFAQSHKRRSGLSFINIALITLVLVYLYLIFAFVFLGFEVDYNYVLENGIWKYSTRNDSFTAVLFHLWFIFSAFFLSYCYYIAYHYTRGSYEKKWKLALFITYTILPLILVLGFIVLPAESDQADYILSPYIAIIVVSMVYSYTNFKLFEVNPLAAMDQIMDSTSNLVILVNSEFKITYVNRTSLDALTLANIENPLNRDLPNLMEKLGMEHVDEIISRMKLLKGNEQYEQEIKFLNQYYLAVATNVYNQNKTRTGYLILGFDLTRIKQSELDLQKYAKRLEESNKELERFAYIASHDLKSPMRNIVSFVGLLERKIDPKQNSDIKEYTQFISTNARYMYRLIQDILEYSKLRKYATDDFEMVDLNEVLNQILILYQDQDTVIRVSTLPSIRSNPSIMTQLFQNLIDNGLKYNTQKIPEVSVTVREIEYGFEFCIADNGIGIEACYLSQIFEMFKRLHNQTQYEGTGIGLAICKKIVELHQGEIWVKSEPGLGTQFFFTLKQIHS
jgi:signal transduction histidine kinase